MRYDIFMTAVDLKPDILTNNERDTLGRRALVTALRRPGINQASDAGSMSKNQSTISQWRSGNVRPEAHLRCALENLLGIPHWYWMTKEEAELVQRMAEVAPRLAA